MQVAHKIDIDRLDKKVDVISDLLAKLGDEDDLRRLVREWRKPGWTTPAEFIFGFGDAGELRASSQRTSQHEIRSRQGRRSSYRWQLIKEPTKNALRQG